MKTRIICNTTKIILLVFTLTSAVFRSQNANFGQSDTSYYLPPIILNHTILVPRQKQPFVFNFNSLKTNDTLQIWSTIMDCGEFGGHNEYIFIYLNRNKLFSKLKREQLCDSASEKNNPQDRFNQFVNLSENSKNNILNYIEKFNQYIPDQHVVSNAPTDFWIKFKGETFYFHDQTGRWGEFISLRNSLFIKK